MKPDYYVKQIATVVIEDSVKNDMTSSLINDLNLMSQLMKNHADLRQLILSKRIEIDIKFQILQELLKQYIKPYTFGVLKLLFEEDVISRMPLFISELEKLRKKSQKLSKVHVEYALEMPGDELKNQIKNYLDGDMDYTQELRPELLGGMKLRIDNIIIDLVSR